MRVKVSGLLSMEIAGNITEVEERHGYLLISMGAHVGSAKAGSVKAALTHKDIMDVLKLLLKPANLCYVIFGFGKPKGSPSSPFQP